MPQGLRDLIDRFDWDGVNLAELYFESLEGYDNPARFTPMNDDVRARVPGRLRDSIRWICSIRNRRITAKTRQAIARFLDFRADLARRQQAEWIAQIEDIRKTKP